MKHFFPRDIKIWRR